ncbi:OmpP1/FadL family transporter [Porphyromonas sp.]
MNIKHKILGVVMLSLLPLSLSAQSEMEAFRLNSPYDPMGSARFAALSGAMGAVGSDVSSLVRNPAGIALFRGSNRLSLTLGSRWGIDKGLWYGSTSAQEGKSKFLFEEFSYQAGTNRATRGPVSFAFSIRNAGRFDRELHASAILPQAGNYSSLADFAAGRTNNALYDNIQRDEVGQYFTKSYLTSTAAFRNDYIPYLSIIGAGSGWIDFDKGSKSYHSAYLYSTAPDGSSYSTPSIGLPDKANLVLREKGSITDYDIAFGLEANEALHLGATLTLSSLDYEMTSFYQELFRENNSLTLQNTKSISGFGGRLGLGFLYEPTDGLRLGASFYTPTFYTMKMDFQAHSEGSYNQMIGEVSTPKNAATSYKLRGPWHLGLNGAYFIGHYGFISVDYEYTREALRLSNNTYNEDYDSDTGFEEDNAHLKANFGGIHTLRLGAEVMLGSRIALRAGYRYSSSPIKNERLKGSTVTTEALVSGSAVHYTLPDNQSSYSIGAGFRLTPSLSLDLAYVCSQTSARTFAFPTLNDYGPYLNASPEQLKKKEVQPINLIGMEGIKETNLRHKAVATLSLRF